MFQDAWRGPIILLPHSLPEHLFSEQSTGIPVPESARGPARTIRNPARDFNYSNHRQLHESNTPWHRTMLGGWRMTAKLIVMRLPLWLILVPPMTLAAHGPSQAPSAQSDALVRRALAAELRTARDTQHPMRYQLRKWSPRLSSTKEILETRDGAVARLLQINDQQLPPADEQKEQDRLDGLLSDPSRQHHRKQAEDSDADRALKVLRALPNAFLYQFAGTGMGPAGKVEKFTFRPNPNFIPPDLETQVLTAMTGELWVDVAQERVTRLEGHLDHDVDIGWGILGRLNKGGWIVIAQADVGGRQWRVVRFQMAMSGRVLFKSRSFDTTEEESGFTPIPAGLTYQQGIQMLRAGQSNASHPSR